MQVANTLNNTIRILFNPKLEAFKLFDFLMVKSDENKYIAQIIEIYDDKFDASQNVAKLKLFYQLNQNNEVIPYDNFTPNKECEIIKVKQDEIENFINQDKETFIFGTNTKSSTALNLQYNFFNNNAVVLADKIENANSITYNLAKNLSTKKNVVIIDQTGVLDYEDAKKIKAGKNFRMPLNYTTIDHVFNKCLNDASLEFQAIGGEIINEIKRFAKKQENEFIPFNQLTKVLMQQYKATPYPELKLLLVRLKKYQMDEIFAKNKTDKDNLFKTIEKNPITILDLSSVDSFWQKAYLDYIISDIEEKIYLIARINDEHFDADLINKIYNKKKNINFVPNVSYNYKRLPSVMQHCKNYILMPSLFQRADFLDANFALSNLISQGCVIFGENTDNFIYLACDYELDVQEKRKNYRKIALSLAQQDNEGEHKESHEAEEKQDSSKIIQELSEFNTKRNAILGQQDDEYIETNAPDEEFDDAKEESFDEIENPDGSRFQENIKSRDEDDLIFNDSLKSSNEIELKTQAKDEFQELKEESEKVEEKSDELVFQEEYKEPSEENSSEETTETIEEPEETFEEETQIDITDEELDFFQMAQESNDEYEDIEEKTIEEPEQTAIQESTEEQTPQIINEEYAQDIEEPKNQSEDIQTNSVEETQEEKHEETQEEINLSEIADNSIDDNFKEIINKKNNQSTQTITINENIKLNESVVAKATQRENLPIFKDEEEENQEDSEMYEIGNNVIHKEYGRGTIIQIMKYECEDKQLLQIEFEQAGKKLLDPKLAGIELE